MNEDRKKVYRALADTLNDLASEAFESGDHPMLEEIESASDAIDRWRDESESA